MHHHQISDIVESALAANQFYARSPYQLQIVITPSETSFWEIFNGHLLSASQTRQTMTFTSWNVFLKGPHRSLHGTESQPSSPLISIKFNPSLKKIFVTRNLLTRTWESYESRPNVIESRPIQRWTPELVTTVDLTNVTERELTIRKISHGISLSLEGTSRLPITSVENPLPDHTFGNCAYFPDASSEGVIKPIDDLKSLIERLLQKDSSRKQRASILETILRSADPKNISCLAQLYYQQWQHTQLPDSELQQTMITMFNQLSLSPYTQLVDNWGKLLNSWADSKQFGSAIIIDSISYILRHLVRHMTAYDLETFHNRGANYPDAMLLDTMISIYLQLIDEVPELFLQETADDPRRYRLRRCALRQACIVRKQYEGHRVPDRPTSPGENQRILPGNYPPVPESQLVDPHARSKKLFDGQPIENLFSKRALRVLDQSIMDLRHETELFELGAAIYLDRPFGYYKQPGEVDRTILLSYVAFSGHVADTRLEQLHRWGWLVDHLILDEIQTKRKNLSVQGVAVRNLGNEGRPGVVALEDAFQAATDFVFVKTTQSSLREFFRQYNTRVLEREFPELSQWLHDANNVLLVRTIGTRSAPYPLVLDAFDEHNRNRLRIIAPTDSLCTYVEQHNAETIRGMRIVPNEQESQESTCQAYELNPVPI